MTPISEGMSDSDDIVQNGDCIGSTADQPNSATPDLPPTTYRPRRDTRIHMDPLSQGVLSFRNISYAIGQRKMSALSTKILPCIKPKPGTLILQNISGVFRQGMNAIMGRKLFINLLQDSVTTNKCYIFYSEIDIIS